MEIKMIVHKKGCLIEAFKKGEVDAIAHVVNCQGVMGSGLALQIKKEFPEAYESYMMKCEVNYDLGFATCELLGDTSLPYPDHYKVYNMFAQDFYGVKDKHLRYYYLTRCLLRIGQDKGNFTPPTFDPKLGVPCLLGCDRAGGDWSVVLEILQDFSDNYGIEIFIYSKD
jgi:hypothetical protein